MTLEEIIDKAIDIHSDKVKEYKAGRTALLGLFVGEAMKLSKGKADPKSLFIGMKNKLNAKL